ncbi:hypothetical protein [Cellulomonas rhizosphaerae]|uniref:hypothetical protein n=1 Tax=Cellulomonas rhizosphaerae TaxID=2293719 RepID=UPI0010FD3516|nr:hypothetical protein [Cellulomonas rhizosphaerae]
MTLEYPSPAAFAQSLRFRLQATPDDVPILVVEGMSDRQAFGRVLDPRVKVVPARGKEMVLESRKHLSVGERERCTIVIDCDGRVEASWLTDDNVVVSANRDLEADLVIELKVMRSVAHDFLAPLYDNGSEVARHANRLERYVLEFACVMGVLLDAARALGAKTRVVDAVTARKRRVQILDLPEALGWLRAYAVPSLQEISNAVGASVGWSEAQREEIVRHACAGGAKLCRLHGAAECSGCKIRRFSNGHDIVDISAQVLSDHGGYAVSSAEVARALRVAIGVRATPQEWSVIGRLSIRQAATGRRLLAS